MIGTARRFAGKDTCQEEQRYNHQNGLDRKQPATSEATRTDSDWRRPGRVAGRAWILETGLSLTIIAQPDRMDRQDDRRLLHRPFDWSLSLFPVENSERRFRGATIAGRT